MRRPPASTVDSGSLVQRDLGRHRRVGEAALVLGWVLICAAVVFVLKNLDDRPARALVVAILFTVVTAVMVVVVVGFGRSAEARVRRGLADAEEALGSIELVTDPALSFLPLDALLSELLTRVRTVVGGDVAITALLSSEGTEVAVRASHGMEQLGELVRADILGRRSGSIVRPVATRAEAVVVNDVDNVPDSPLSGHVASLVAAPLLVGDRVTGVVMVATRAPHCFRPRDLHLLQLVADRSAASIERARLDDAERRSRLGVEHARLHVALLARAGDVLAPALESHERALADLVDVVVPSFADWFAVDLVEDDGTLRRIADSGGVERYPLSAGRELVRRAIDTGRPEVLMATRRDGPPHGGEPAAPGQYCEADPSSGIESMLVVPVHLRGAAFGALCFATGASRRGYRRSDLDTAEGLADRVAVAVERVLLWHESTEAERDATRHAAQLRRLMEAALAVHAPLAEPQVLRVVSDHARRVLEAQQAVVISAPLSEALSGAIGGARIEASSPDVLDERREEDARWAASLVGRVGRPLRWSHGELDNAPSELADQVRRVGSRPAALGQTEPWLAVPLHYTGATRAGAIVVLGSPGAAFGTEDESVLVLLAQMASVALDNARLYQAVQGNEQRLRAVLDSSPLAIAELDLTGAARWWNRAAGILLGWDDISVHHPRTVPHRDGEAAVQLSELWACTRRGEATVGAEIRGTRLDGEPLEMSVSTAPLHDRTGTVTGILAVVEDITQRRQMLEQFHQAERLSAMARLAGGVAHDFNNLLTVILGCSEILLHHMSDTGSDERLMSEVLAIQRAGQRATALTNQLLSIGRRRVVQPEVVDPDVVVGSMTPMLARVLGQDVALDVVPSELPTRIAVDPAELERAVLNLAINARDAMPGGGRFVVTTRVVASPTSGPSVAMVLEDTGAGMDAETAEHCFEPFFTSKRNGRGTGLGLAAVHAMVTQARGQVTLDNAPGRGSTFTLRFPAVDAASHMAPMTEEPEVAGLESVLVVEDEPELRRLVVEELRRTGYRVAAVSDGAQALEVADSCAARIDLLVTDVVMSGMGGMELADELTRRWPGLPVLFVSGHLGDTDRAATHSRRSSWGDDADLLAKPFTPGQLARRVRLCLDRAAAGRRAWGPAVGDR